MAIKLRAKNIVSSLIFLIFIIVFICLFVPVDKAYRQDSLITVLFLLMGGLAACGMIISLFSRAFSVRFIFWLFCFAFLFCGGMTQFADNRFCWEFIPTKEEILYANGYILLFMAVFALSGISVLRVKKSRRAALSRLLESNLRLNTVLFLSLQVILLLCGGYALRARGLAILFSRELFDTYSFSSMIASSSIRSVVGAVINSVCMCCAILAMEQFKKRENVRNAFFMVLALITLLIHVPPVAVPRFTFAGVYGGIFLYTFDWIKKGKRFAYILILGLFMIFPMLNAFRYASSDGISLELIRSSIGEVTENFKKADYDAYTMVVYSVRYVQTHGITWGKQLLGAALFFVPRKLWPGKPEGSGSMIISEMAPSYINSNVSCPIVGEGILNFGVAGVLLFSFLLGKIAGKIDRLYWERWNRNRSCGGIMYCYVILFALLLFRGDLMSSTAFLTGMVVTTIAFCFLFRERRSHGDEVSADV